MSLGRLEGYRTELPTRRAPGSRRKRTAERVLITESLKPAEKSDTSVILLTPSAGAKPYLVDLSKSLLASHSDLGPYWGRGVSRKRNMPEMVDPRLGWGQQRGEKVGGEQG